MLNNKLIHPCRANLKLSEKKKSPREESSTDVKTTVTSSGLKIGVEEKRHRHHSHHHSRHRCKGRESG